MIDGNNQAIGGNVDVGNVANTTNNDVNLDNMGNDFGLENNLQDNQNPLLNDVVDNLTVGDELDLVDNLINTGVGTFEGVDISEFEEVLDFESPESRQEIVNNIRGLKDAGLNDDQIKLVIKNQIGLYMELMEDMPDQEEEREMTPQEIRENLERNLTYEEKRNVKPMLEYLKQSVSSDILSNEVLTNIFSDPTSVKIIHALYKSSIGNTNMVREPRQETVNKGSMQLTPQVAMEYYKDWLGRQSSVTREETLGKINALRGYVNSDAIQEFDELFSVLK